MKQLSTQQIITEITEGKVSLRLSLLLATTTKEFVIYTKDSIFQTDDLVRTLDRISKDNPGIKANDVSVVNAKEYKEHLLTVNN
jgi:hypothetical protein